jgi:hypothetical protein
VHYKYGHQVIDESTHLEKTCSESMHRETKINAKVQL